MSKLFLSNTLGRKKEEFVSQKKDIVSIYGCGVTPYDQAHIGHGRSYVFIDLLVRFLKFSGCNTKYVRNVTDIDDKLLKKAESLGDIKKYKEIAEKFTTQYQQEMRLLNNLDPDIEPKVTDHIGKIIIFIQELINSGYAYVVDQDVYFDVSKYSSYGELSGKNLDDLVAGARVKVDERKKNPADFALWKSDERIFWGSPWGNGRPGWHIECSVLAKEYLGETIDIHCGGSDLIFPHHENERAQSEALYKKTFAKYWLHNGLLKIDKEKMSKSLGNILSLEKIFEKYDPIILRYYFLQHHYRTPIDFRFDMLDSASVAYKKLVSVFEKTEPSQEKKSYELIDQMIDALSDDLNSPKMLGILFENLSQIRADKNLAAATKNFLQQVLGLTLAPLPEKEITPEIKSLIEQREQARKEKKWGLADKIREQLRELGYEVRDEKL
jgi:cysteinyl-tRNA synthetase